MKPKPGSCERATRVVPLIGDRFVAKPLVDDKGRLPRPAPSSRPAPAAASRTAASTPSTSSRPSITYGPDNIAVREQLALTRRRAGVGPGNGSFVTRVQAERQLTLKDGTWSRPPRRSWRAGWPQQ